MSNRQRNDFELVEGDARHFALLARYAITDEDGRTVIDTRSYAVMGNGWRQVDGWRTDGVLIEEGDNGNTQTQ